MDIIVFLRIIITLTFLILAIGGPVAILQLRRFIKLHYQKHAELQVKVESLEKRIVRLEPSEPGGKS
jgi:hypothetical protein